MVPAAAPIAMLRVWAFSVLFARYSAMVESCGMRQSSGASPDTRNSPNRFVVQRRARGVKTKARLLCASNAGARCLKDADRTTVSAHCAEQLILGS